MRKSSTWMTCIWICSLEKSRLSIAGCISGYKDNWSNRQTNALIEAEHCISLVLFK